jgi:predicted nucleotidyltransferase
MPIIGIIAEYNPFHQGHLYHLRTIQKELSPQGIICVLGGNFLQRGEPALVNKWARCAMALQQGIDLVFELPVLYATRSAYWFARGGIETLTSTGITTHLAFGVETKQNILLKKAAAYLASEPKAYQQKLQNLLKQGLSYPQARTQALPPEFLPILQSPNNILGLTYLQIIQELDLNLIPFILKRKGSDYLNKDLTNYIQVLVPSAII